LGALCKRLRLETRQSDTPLSAAPRPRESRNGFLAATEQHREILAGLCSWDPLKARQAFVSSTLKFWKDCHQVSIGEAFLLPAPRASGGTVE
jgi:hypothetical protein